jgi:hypothetical protein
VLSRQERLDYQNPERNERLVKRYDEPARRHLGAGADLSSLVVRNASNAEEGYFDCVWLPGVAFDVTPGGNVSTERLKHCGLSLPS